MLRKLHRWTSFPLIIVLILVIGTGVFLQFEEVAGLAGEEAPAAVRPAQADADLNRSTAQLTDALARLEVAEPDFRPTRVELSVAPGRESTRFAMQARGGPFVEIDHASGEVRSEMNPATPLHVVMIRLHTGAAFGAAGIVVMLVGSLILLFLAGSGIVLYWQMWRNRVKRGRGELFWK